MKTWNIEDRIEVTTAGRAYAACVKAEEETLDACAEVQEGASPTLLDAPMGRQSEALDYFHAMTGTHFYHPDSEEDPAVRAGIKAALVSLGIEIEGESNP